MDLFHNILSDNTSGSGSILKKVQQLLIVTGKSNASLNKDALNDSLMKLIGSFPQFGLLIHFYQYLTHSFQAIESTAVEGSQLVKLIELYSKLWTDRQTTASLHLLSKIDLDGKSVLLHSNSSAILNLFKAAKKNSCKTLVWQTYSSPEGEGRIQAEILLDKEFEVNLFHEDNLNKFIDQIDLAIIGADIIFEDRFLNKSGSYPIALMLEKAGVPLYVLAERRKVMREHDLPPDMLSGIIFEKNKAAAGLEIKAQEGLRVHNHYFEFVPLSMVKEVFLEI